MAYGASGLTRLSSGGGGNLWLYRSTDASTAADAAGYFNDAVNFLNIGDVILYQQVRGSATAPTSITATGFLVVNANSGTVVDTTDITSVQASDSD